MAQAASDSAPPKRVYDAWVLTTHAQKAEWPAYLSNSKQGVLIGREGQILSILKAGDYDANGNMIKKTVSQNRDVRASEYTEPLDMRTGVLAQLPLAAAKAVPLPQD